ncbi:hypothetical protein [Streptomyces sp. NPDC001820]|uniref:hypothetical protein n=1 Tax=Streptomyces sp. NPDC001820 TaxID=3364613 RepID=UPI0036AE7561
MTKQLVVNGPGEAWASAVDGHLRWIHNAALDALAAERGRHDREETVRHLGQRLADLPGPLPVLPAPVPHGGEPELAAVRALVEEFARGSGRALWRDRRIAAQVADHCEAVTGIADEAIAAGRLSRTEVEERAKQAQVLLDKESQQWEQLHLDLTSRQLALADRLRTRIHKERDGLIERLRWELERTQDPGGWWKRDLPVRLRHELSLLAQRSERTVLPGLTADVEWLDAEVAVRLPGASPSHVPAGLGVAVEPQFSGEISDLSRIRLATRLGAQGGAIVGYLIAFARTASTRMIYGAAFSLIGGLLAEGAVRSATEQQRREVDTALVRVVDDSTVGDQAVFRSGSATGAPGLVRAFHRFHTPGTGVGRRCTA